MRPIDAKLNRNHPLARGLQFAYIGSSGTPRDARRGWKPQTHSEPRQVFNQDLNRLVVELDGSDDSVYWDQLSLSGSFSAFCWLRKDVDSVQFAFTYWRDSTGFTIAPLGGGKVRFQAAGISATLDTTTEYTLDKWFPAAMTYDSTTIRCYIYGNEEVTDTGTMTWNASTWVRFGGINLDNPPTLPFGGLMADCMIWDRVLSPAEIRQLSNPANIMLSGLVSLPARKLFTGFDFGGPNPTALKPIVMCTF